MNEESKIQRATSGLKVLFYTTKDIDKKGIRIAVAERSAYDLWLTKNIKKADLIVWDICKLEELPFVIDHSPIKHVFKSGKKLLSEGINYEVAFNKRFETSKEMLQKANLGNRGEFFLPVMASKSNCYAVDVDGNEYIDLSLSNGMISFGHAYEFNEGLKSSNSRLSYKNHGFADKISTLLKANRYSKKI